MADNKEYTRAVRARFLQVMNTIIAQKRNGISNKSRFADEVGEYPQNFTLMESGTRYPTVESCVLICKKFGVSADWLLHGLGTMFPIDKKETVDIKERLVELELRVQNIEKNESNKKGNKSRSKGALL